ncbi:MAG: hypothetical protein D6690_14775 [Nitrospirae bacterium]|nr:MAG: hypothetical protein D6690_14775 [Nitrospirota bacterium]
MSYNETFCNTFIAHHEEDDDDQTRHLLPDHVHLSPEDDPQERVEEILRKYEEEYEKTADSARERYWRRETRFEEDEDEPSLPIISRTASRAPKEVQRFIVLPDGRRVRRLYSRDSKDFRIETLCGIRQILPINQALSVFRHKTGNRECPRCHGRHLPDPVVHDQVASHINPPKPACPKCQHSATHLYHEDAYTIACAMCGYRLYLPLPTLSDEEVDHNEQVIDEWIYAHDVNALDDSVNEPLDEYDDSIAFTEHLSVVEISAESLPETIAEIGDQLHWPAFRLYKTRSPFRQAMLNRTLQDGRFDQLNMIRWVAAGRLADELGDISAKKSAELVEWLWQLNQATLESMAGDDDSPIPCLAHPTMDLFEPSEIMIRGLRTHLLTIISRCKPTPATINGLAHRFRLAPATIETLMAQQRSVSTAA